MDPKDALFQCLDVVRCLPVLGKTGEEMERVRWLKRSALQQMLAKVRAAAPDDPRLQKYRDEE